MSRIKVAIIGSAGIPANYGGFETLTEYLVNYLNEEFDLLVYCSTYNYQHKLSTYHGAKLIYLPVRANGHSSIVYDSISLIHSIFRPRVLLVLGVGGAFLFPFIRLVSRRKIIVNIDGLEWKRQKWNAFAKWYLKLQERIAIKYAHTVITDNRAIQEYVSEQHHRSSELISYGGDHTRPSLPSDATGNQYSFLSSFFAFCVCRIEPENNTHLILEGFSRANKVNLVIVGNWHFSDYGKKLRQEYHGRDKIFLIDAIYDLAQLDYLRSNCGLYVHGHSAGGTNPSLVEAMSLGLPVLAYDVNYNRFTTENKALYFKDVSELAEVVGRVATGEQDLSSIAKDLKNVADREYTWLKITGRYAQVINNLAINDA